MKAQSKVIVRARSLIVVKYTKVVTVIVNGIAEAMNAIL